MATNHGSSTRITQGPEPIIAKAQFMDFAPAPCSLYGCCISEHQQVRMYAHVKETNMEMNFPEAPYGCCTCDEQCVNDGIVKMYYDRPVHRSGLCPYPYCCIPFTCCGPPVSPRTSATHATHARTREPLFFWQDIDALGLAST